MLVLARWVLDELAGWAVVLGNLLAAAGMLTYYFKKHRSLASRLAQAFAEEA